MTQEKEQDLDQLFGEPGRADYKIGDHLLFLEDGVEKSGEIIHIAAPTTTVMGRLLPTTFSVDCGDGFPHVVLPSQVIQR